MGILGNLFGMDDERSSDIGARIALAGQALMAMDQGQVPNIAPSIAALNERRRKIADEMKTTKWMQNQAAAMADKNPRLAAMLQDPNLPPEIGSGLISKYIATLPEFQLPEWKTFESGGDIYRYNPLDPNSKPEMFYDGPDDPFKTLLKSIDPSAGQPPAPVPSAPAEAGAPPPSGSATPDMPPAPSASVLTPQQQMLAQAFGLPPNATVDDVMAVARAGAISEENARATASNIIDRYKTADTNRIDLSEKQVEWTFKLHDDYKSTADRYQKIIDTATEVASLPEDPGGFQRIAVLYKTMKTLDPGGAVMSADTNLAQSAATPLDRMDQLIQQYSGVSGTDIPLTAVKEMKALVLQLGEVASKADYIKRKNILGRAKAVGIPEDKIEAMIFGSLQDGPDVLEGYQPRFTPGERETDIQMQSGGDVDAPAAGVPANLPRVMTDADYEALDPGALYVAPNGKVKKKGGAQ